MSLELACSHLDALFGEHLASHHIPGIAYGIVDGNAFVHARGLGAASVSEPSAPNLDTVFRIASMTRSFTAAAVPFLRDQGRLRLDDPVATHVPELAGIRLEPESPSITIRHLLTMNAGMPTDDLWAHRQQALPPSTFADLLRTGFTFNRPPGGGFEYSNLGYAILGRVVANVSGSDYGSFVQEDSQPLELRATGYRLENVQSDRLAPGYVWPDGTWVAEPIDGVRCLRPDGWVVQFGHQPAPCRHLGSPTSGH